MEDNKIDPKSDIAFIEKSLKNVKEMFDKGEINKETYDAVRPIYLEVLEKIKCLQQNNEKN